MIKDVDEWHKIGNKLTKELHICGCQRKLKSIIEVLNNIRDKHENGNDSYTGEEYLILALIDANTNKIITHGTNCEWPILTDLDGFWKWIREVRDSPYLEDN